jgi:hypothetical protein
MDWTNITDEVIIFVAIDGTILILFHGNISV